MRYLYLMLVHLLLNVGDDGSSWKSCANDCFWDQRTFDRSTQGDGWERFFELSSNASKCQVCDCNRRRVCNPVHGCEAVENRYTFIPEAGLSLNYMQVYGELPVKGFLQPAGGPPHASGNLSSRRPWKMNLQDLLEALCSSEVPTTVVINLGHWLQPWKRAKDKLDATYAAISDKIQAACLQALWVQTIAHPHASIENTTYEKFIDLDFQFVSHRFNSERFQYFPTKRWLADASQRDFWDGKVHLAAKHNAILACNLWLMVQAFHPRAKAFKLSQPVFCKALGAEGVRANLVERVVSQHTTTRRPNASHTHAQAV